MFKLTLTVISAVIVGAAAFAGVARYTDHAFGLVPVTPYEADVNKDAKVNAIDLMQVAQKYGQPVPSATATPSSVCDLSGRNLAYLRAEYNNGTIVVDPPATWATFDGCRFVGSNLSRAQLRNSHFRNADFTGASLDESVLIEADFTDAIFVGATFLNLQDSTNANFSGANFTNAVIATCCNDSLDGATFEGATTAGADVSGVMWRNTTCPDGTNSDNNGGSCIGHGFAGTPLATWTPTATATPTPVPCAGGAAAAMWAGGNQHCYIRFNGPLSWTDAESACQARGGHLVSILSQAEQDFVWVSVAAVDTWIGLTDRVTENQWEWASGEPFSYSYWNGGEPNNGGGDEDGVLFATQSGDGRWNDAPLSVERPYVCEFE